MVSVMNLNDGEDCVECFQTLENRTNTDNVCLQPYVLSILECSDCTQERKSVLFVENIVLGLGSLEILVPDIFEKVPSSAKVKENQI